MSAVIHVKERGCECGSRCSMGSEGKGCDHDAVTTCDQDGIAHSAVRHGSIPGPHLEPPLCPLDLPGLSGKQCWRLQEQQRSRQVRHQ